MRGPANTEEKHLDADVRGAKVPIQCSLDSISDAESTQSDLQEEVEAAATQNDAEQAVPAAKVPWICWGRHPLETR